MNAQTHLDETVSRTGMPVAFYSARLRDDELVALTEWAKFCRRDDRVPPAPLVGAFLDCIVAVERERRESIEEGCEVLEVSMPEIPCQYWTNASVSAAIGKLASLTQITDGEVNVLMRKLFSVVIAEAQHRLELTN